MILTHLAQGVFPADGSSYWTLEASEHVSHPREEVPSDDFAVRDEIERELLVGHTVLVWKCSPYAVNRGVNLIPNQAHGNSLTVLG